MSILRAPLVLAGVSAALVNLAARPWMPGYLVWVALVPGLYGLAHQRGPVRAAATGWVLGLGVMLPAFEGAAVEAPWAYAVLVVGMAAWFALLGALVVSLKGSLGRPVALGMVPFLWVAAEVLPAQGTLWGAWASPPPHLAYTQADTPLLMAAAWSSGTGVTFLVVLLNVALVWALLVRPRRRAAVGVATAIAVAAAAVVFSPAPQRDQNQAGLRTAAVQGAVSTLDTIMGRFDDVAADEVMDAYEELTGRAAERGPDLVVWGETAIPRPVVGSDASARVQRALAGVDTAIVGGISQTDAGRYNSAFVWQDGRLDEVYRKQRLIPLFEAEFDAGPPVPPLRVGEAGVGLSICLDVAYPGLLRDAVQRGAHVLITLTNDDFAKSTVTPYLHMNVAAVGAAATGRPLLFLDQAGPSAFFDARGRATITSEQGTRVALVDVLMPHDGITPYVRYGDWLGTLALLLAALCLLFTITTRIWERSTRTGTPEVSPQGTA